VAQMSPSCVELQCVISRSYFNETYDIICLDGRSFVGFFNNRTLDSLCPSWLPRRWVARRRRARWWMAWWLARRWMERCRLAWWLAPRWMEGGRLAWWLAPRWMARRLGSGRSTRRSCARSCCCCDLGLSRLLCLPWIRVLLFRPLPAAGLVARRMAVDQRVPLSEHPGPEGTDGRGETLSLSLSVSPAH